MKNVEIITNIGWLLLIFFTRDKVAEARYKVPKTYKKNKYKYTGKLKTIILSSYSSSWLKCQESFLLDL